MFEKYKIISYALVSKLEWGIHKRFMLFWHRPMIHMKYVILYRDNIRLPISDVSSREILTFETREAAEDEIDRLGFDLPPVVSRTYEDGVMIKEEYYAKRR